MMLVGLQGSGKTTTTANSPALTVRDNRKC